MLQYAVEQGPRSNCEIGGRGGGGGTVSDSIWWAGGTRHLFLLILCNSKNIAPPRPPAPRSLRKQTMIGVPIKGKLPEEIEMNQTKSN